MEFLLDTINIEQIKKYNDIIALSGVTSNPSIVKKEGKIDFFNHMKTIREIIGKESDVDVTETCKQIEKKLIATKNPKLKDQPIKYICTDNPSATVALKAELENNQSGITYLWSSGEINTVPFIISSLKRFLTTFSKASKTGFPGFT